jgi:D-ornithine 4,5-aminomutase subunit alpha
MGFSSMEAKTLVEKTIEHQWMGKGAGHVVYILSLMEGIDIRSAGLKLMANEGWEKVAKHFGGKAL